MFVYVRLSNWHNWCRAYRMPEVTPHTTICLEVVSISLMLNFSSFSSSQLVIVAVWITSAVYSVPKFIFVRTITNNLGDDQLETICIVNRKAFNSELFDIINFALLYLLPLLVMTVSWRRRLLWSGRFIEWLFHRNALSFCLKPVFFDETIQSMKWQFSLKRLFGEMSPYNIPNWHVRHVAPPLVADSVQPDSDRTVEELAGVGAPHRAAEHDLVQLLEQLPPEAEQQVREARRRRHGESGEEL